MKYTVVIIPSSTRTRVLVSHGCDELLRAILPPPSSVHHERAAITFLQGLSLWLDAKLHVVLSVDEREAGFCLALADEMGIGMRSVYFDVEVHVLSDNYISPSCCLTSTRYSSASAGSRSAGIRVRPAPAALSQPEHVRRSRYVARGLMRRVFVVRERAALT
jgi:hypothetical protein